MSAQKINKKEQKSQFAVQIYKSICYGTVSFWQGKKADEKHTHKWCAFVRGPNNEDLSTFIDNIEFILHPSFEPPKITIKQMPFQIIQSGWGEFEITMQIQFKEEFTTPLEIYHQLKLYHSNTSSSQSTKKPVISEFYDEIVFVNPSDKFKKLLEDSKPIPMQIPLSIYQQPVISSQQIDDNLMKDENEEVINDFHNYFTQFDQQEKEHKQKLEDALKVVKLEVERLTQEAKKLDFEIINLHKDASLLQ